jgi:ferredoxin
MKAMKFTFGRKPAFGQNVENSTSTDTGKRRFLLTGIAGIASVPLLMAQNKLNGGKPYLRKNAISPPGALSREHLQRHCTSCHLCIDKCPTQVLKPAFTEYGLGGMMQPMMYFEKGYCNYSCTLCSEVCPTGALKPLTVAEKHLTQVGQVVFVEDLCVVHTEGTNCGACAEHCPTQAVTMVPYKNELTIPHTNPEICVGCGGCEYICPVRPHRAIHVEANLEHKKAKPFDKGEKQKVEIQDFGF